MNQATRRDGAGAGAAAAGGRQRGRTPTPSRTTTPAPSGPALGRIDGEDPVAAELDQVSAALERAVEALSGLANERLDALRRADAGAIARCVGQENELVQSVAGLEARRASASAALSARLGGTGPEAARLSWLAERIDGPVGRRLRERSARLSAGLVALRRVNGVGEMAASRLSAHMEGLWRQAAASLNHAKVYGRRGAVDPGPRVVSAVDVRS